MPVHALVEATAAPGRLDDLLDAARGFLDAVRERERKCSRVEACRIEGARTLLVHLVFEDALAAENHRSRDHTETFTDALDAACEEVDVHELAPVDGTSP